MPAATEAEVRQLQKTLNRFTNRWLKGVAPLVVDGDRGHATKSRVRAVKWYLGYTDDEQRSSEITSAFIRRVRHPRDREYAPARMIARGAGRRLEQRNRWRRTQVLSYLVPGVTRWEGVAVAKCAVPYLNYARAHGWDDSLNSGWRDPIYSRGLCIRMCGASSCPGRCAGLASNHVGNSCARFALDVMGYVLFGQLMPRMPLQQGMPRIFNALGAQDPVHFSPNGR